MDTNTNSGKLGDAGLVSELPSVPRSAESQASVLRVERAPEPVYLSAADILGMPDSNTITVDVPVPAWGGKVATIKKMDSDERDAFEIACMAKGADGKDKFSQQGIRAKLVVRTLVDKTTGARLFSDDTAPILAKKEGDAMSTLFFASAKLNKITGEDIEELAKNSGSARTDASASDSQ